MCDSDESHDLSKMQALVRSAHIPSHNETPELGEIYRCTIGVIFIATPRRGSDKMKLGEIVDLMAKLASRQPITELLKALVRNSSDVFEILKNLTTIYQSLKLVPFYEKSSTGAGLVRLTCSILFKTKIFHNYQTN